MFGATGIIPSLISALVASAYLYLNWAGFSYNILNTIFGVLALYLLLGYSKSVEWFWSGFFIGILWFWWIPMSFRFYGFGWAMPIGILIISLVYGGIFWMVAYSSEKLEQTLWLNSLWFKALFLLTASSIHPFGFDWFKPELMFVESYLGIYKWQFALILFAIVMSLSTKRWLYLTIILLAYQPSHISQSRDENIKLVTTKTPISAKHNPEELYIFVEFINNKIQEAISQKKKIIVFPESILSTYLNKEHELMEYYLNKSFAITIVIGALHWDEGVPRNSTYIFKDGKYIIADKIVLVPFGESNPLPEWMSDIVNKIFFDGAIDYQANSNITDYNISNQTYRNAICYESCSEKLYSDEPKNMIVLSDNGWFVPSIEPTQQRLLLQYYSRKYGTTIYHALNMSPSYIIRNGKITWIDTEI